jgi:hypothetical protein
MGHLLCIKKNFLFLGLLISAGIGRLMGHFSLGSNRNTHFGGQSAGHQIEGVGVGFELVYFCRIRKKILNIFGRNQPKSSKKYVLVFEHLLTW